MRRATIALLVSLLFSGSAFAGKTVSGSVGAAVSPRPPAAAHPGHGHGHRHSTVVVGGGFGYGWGWWYPPPYYYYPVGVPVEPMTYIEQADTAVEPARWWYYCESSTSYYPYVKECPAGWERVPPR